MVLSLVVPMIKKLASLNLNLNLNPQWTNEDLEIFLHYLVVKYEHIKLRTCNVSVVPL
jgi:hypothetical protein